MNYQSKEERMPNSPEGTPIREESVEAEKRSQELVYSILRINRRKRELNFLAKSTMSDSAVLPPDRPDKMSFVVPKMFLFLIWLPYTIQSVSMDDRANQWLNIVNEEFLQLEAAFAQAKWNYETNISSETSKAMLEAGAANDAYERSVASVVRLFDTRTIEDPMIRRQIEQLQMYAVNETIWTEETSGRERSLINSMTTIFNTKSICSWQYGRDFCSQRWLFDPDILVVVATQKNYDFLAYVWKGWRDAVGPSIRPLFVEEIKLRNLKARAMGYEDWGAVWRSFYETPNFAEEASRLFYEILPLYEQLHAYARRRLREFYRNRFSGPTIPAHIFGNVMAEEWSNIYRITLPFPQKPYMDVTRTLQSLGYDQRKLFQLADDFYTSMGMWPAPDSLWTRSIFARIPNRPMVCHATSWDMFRGRDVRIRMCAKVTQYDLLIAHHEMGHIQYFLQYADLPITFRQPANPGFHESIGDTIALAASTRRRMQSLGLVARDEAVDSESDLNWLYKQALFKVPFLVFSYMVDSWRWRVFDGTHNGDNLNKAWWDAYLQLMGLVPPMARNESDFDAGAKSHIIEGVEFIRYFISGVIQFQFYEAMCKAANHSGALHECDFYGSREAGQKMAAMLRLGSSTHWTKAMQLLTGDSRMSGQPLLAYFRPLYDWLKGENARNGECYGWGQKWPDSVMDTLAQPRC